MFLLSLGRSFSSWSLKTWHIWSYGGLVSMGLMSHTALDVLTQVWLLETLGQWGLGNYFWQ